MAKILYDLELDGYREVSVSAEKESGEVRLTFYRKEKDGEVQEFTIKLNKDRARDLVEALGMCAVYSDETG